jgi:C-terminal processing protease CtpA/Prc
MRAGCRRITLFSTLVLAVVAAPPMGEGAPPGGGDRGQDGAVARDAAVTYEEALRDLYEVLGQRYPGFELKDIDWDAVGRALLPGAAEVQDDRTFGLRCMELVAQLQDSHATLLDGAVPVPRPPMPRWNPGLACLEDDRGQAVVYHVVPGGPADSAGVRPGEVVISVDNEPVDALIEREMERMQRYHGYSSRRYLRYHAVRWFTRRSERGADMQIVLRGPDGAERGVLLPAALNARYLPRLPVPIPGIDDSGNVSWTRLEGDIGYIHVRRIRDDLIDALDRAVGELQDSAGLIVDVRGNSGGGFDGSRSHLNFATDQDGREPARPRYRGPIAVLIDARCISAGEGWASWFVAEGRARFFGEATAGASARKTVYTLRNGLYRVRFPVKLYRGYLDRPIERRGLEPDVPLRQDAADLAAGRDTVLEAARRDLLEAAKHPAP